ncbi:uncharacterized protein ACIBXB_003395 [Morphnus guianensis]
MRLCNTNSTNPGTLAGQRSDPGKVFNVWMQPTDIWSKMLAAPSKDYTSRRRSARMHQGCIMDPTGVTFASHVGAFCQPKQRRSSSDVDTNWFGPTRSAQQCHQGWGNQEPLVPGPGEGRSPFSCCISLGSFPVASVRAEKTKRLPSPFLSILLLTYPQHVGDEKCTRRLLLLDRCPVQGGGAEPSVSFLRFISPLLLSCLKTAASSTPKSTTQQNPQPSPPFGPPPAPPASPVAEFCSSACWGPDFQQPSHFEGHRQSQSLRGRREGVRTEYQQSKAAQPVSLESVPQSPASCWFATIPNQSSCISAERARDPAATCVLPACHPGMANSCPGAVAVHKDPISSPHSLAPGKVRDAGVCNPTCRHPCWTSAEASQMSFFPPKSTRGISPRLDVLAGDPVDFELFSGSIKQGLQTGIKGVSLLHALWESCSCGLASLSFLVRASRHTCVIPRMENSPPSRAITVLFPLPFSPPSHLLKKQKLTSALQRMRASRG